MTQAIDAAGPLTAIVTGGGGGLGRAICERLAADGWRVAVIDNDSGGADEVVAALTSTGGEARAWPIDLRSTDAIRAVVDEIDSEFGPAAALVNNAAIFPSGSFLDVSPADYDDTIAVNQRAYFFAAQALADRLRQRSAPGAIVNVASITQHGGWSDMVPYATTKGAAATFTRALATELGPHEIRVNCVAPGAFPTKAEDMHDDPVAYSQRIIDSQALKRRGRLEDVGAAVAFLLGPDSAFITGQTLNVDGGWIMA